MEIKRRSLKHMVEKLQKELSDKIILKRYKNYLVVEDWHAFHMQIRNNKITYISAIDSYFPLLKWLYSWWIDDLEVIDDLLEE